MAEICCEEAKSTPATAVAAASVSATAAAAAAVAVASSALERRRRRLEMRRFRVAGDPEAPVAEDVRAAKRQRLARTLSSTCPDAGSGSGSDSDRPALPERLPRYGVTSVCGRRREMEDTVSVRPDFVPGTSKQHFFGVFDGHGCSHVRHTRTRRARI
jgi:protein phosphatase 2C